MTNAIKEYIEQKHNVYVDADTDMYNVGGGYDAEYGWDNVPLEWIAEALDADIIGTNDKLYIAYTAECCTITRTLVWLESEHGDNSEESSNGDYCTYETTARDLVDLIERKLDGSAYDRRIAQGLQDELSELIG